MTAGQLSLRAMKTWLSTLIHQRRRLRVQLHFILLVATLSSIASVSISRRVTIKNEILYPSLQNYEQLSTESVSRLQCPCTQASIPNRLFMNLSISGQHQVCSSSFVTEEWLSTLVPSDPISTHSVYDFRKIAIGVFQLLASLCRLSEKYVTDEIFNLMARNYINPYVVPRTQFTKQVQSLIDQFQSMISVEFLATVRLIRKMISDNTLMTVFETNWRWTSFNLVDLDTPIGLELYTEPIVYNGSCSCGLSSHCVQPSSTALGFMIGCYPFEALLKSTMECLYHVSCFSQIQSVTRLFQPLNQSISSRYEKNSTIESILDSLMIEQWASNFSYENYFDSCVPISCSYSYIEHNLSLDVLALLLGLYGGLVIIMNVIAPILTALLRELWVRCRRHQSQIQVVEFDVTVTQHS